MIKPLGISEIVARAGDENIQVQNLILDTTELRHGKNALTITFATDPKFVSTDGKASHVGLVLWIPSEIIDRINAENKIE